MYICEFKLCVNDIIFRFQYDAKYDDVLAEILNTMDDCDFTHEGIEYQHFQLKCEQVFQNLCILD